MAEEPPGPPEPLDWNPDGKSLSSLGCFGFAFGLLFLATGGGCVFVGFSAESFIQIAIGLGLMACGWAMMKEAR